MKSWLLQSADVWRLLKRLRPYLGAGRGLLVATLASSLIMVVFEGVGVGLLVPLLSLLLGGQRLAQGGPVVTLQLHCPWLRPWQPGWPARQNRSCRYQLVRTVASSGAR